MPPISSIVDQPNLLATQQGAEAPAKTSPTKAEEKTSAWGSGDTVTLSDVGRKLSGTTPQSSATAMPAEDKSFIDMSTPIFKDIPMADASRRTPLEQVDILQKPLTITTKLGATVKIAHGTMAGEGNAITAIITDKSGNTNTYSFANNAIISEEHDGTITFRDLHDQYEIDGSANDDRVINSNAGFVRTHLGDDTVVNIKPSECTIDTGEGDDVVRVGSMIGRGRYDHNTRITTGQGNDKILATHLVGVTIDTGDGDDTVIAQSIEYSDDIITGDGDDTIKSKLITNSFISTGQGNDDIIADRYETGDISTGDGNDTIIIKRIGLRTDEEALYSGDINHGVEIRMGHGDDRLGAEEVSWSWINTGHGNDSVHIDGNVDHCRITLASGDDTVDIGGTISNSSISSTAGDKFIALRGEIQQTVLRITGGSATLKVSKELLANLNRLYESKL